MYHDAVAEPSVAAGPLVAAQAPALSAGAAARRLGVAPATLRSWDRRYGLGPSGHRSGAHRRYTQSDMARLEAACRLVAEGVPLAEAALAVPAGRAEPAIEGERAADRDQPRDQSRDQSSDQSSDQPHDLPPDQPHDQPPDQSCDLPRDQARHRPGAAAGGGHTLPIGRPGSASARGLARCAIRLDAPQVLELLEAAFARDGVVAVWQHTIEPALRAVGRKWTETDGRYVEVEHLLSWCVTVALHRALALRPANVWSRGRGVLLACAPDEWHSLPLEVLTAALTRRGTPVRMLGPAVPGAALLEAARRTWPGHIVLWSHAPSTADTVTLMRLHALPGVRVIAAGAGWIGRMPPGTAVVHSLQQALDACE